MNKVTVVGTGYTGARILKRLAPGTADGISRSMPDGIDPGRIVCLDLDGEVPEFDTAASVIYTVAPADDDEPDPRLARFLHAIKRPPQRFVYLSTTGVYGDRDGARVFESDAPAPQSVRAKRRVAAEQMLERWCSDAGCSLVILRVPGIYGPGRLGLDRIRRREAMIREAEATPGNRIHVEDLVSCCIAASYPDRPAGIFNLGDGDTRSSTWFSSEVARQAGIEPGPEISREQAERTFSERRLSFLSESRLVDTTKMRDVLGVVPAYADAAQGIRDSLHAEADPQQQWS